MLNLDQKTLLVVAPHADDEVLGCGGLMQKVKQAGGKVYVLFLTAGDTVDFSGQGNSNLQDRLTEVEKATSYMSVDGYRVAFPGNQYHLRLDTVAQKDLIFEIESGENVSLQAVKPDIIATSLHTHYNQDHRVASQATFAATRPMPEQFKAFQPLVLGYEQVNDTWHPHATQSANCYIELTEEEVDKKIIGYYQHASQVRTGHHPRSGTSIKTHARLRGAEAGVPFAESYYIYRLVS